MHKSLDLFFGDVSDKLVDSIKTLVCNVIFNLRILREMSESIYDNSKVTAIEKIFSLNEETTLYEKASEDEKIGRLILFNLNCYLLSFGWTSLALDILVTPSDRVWSGLLSNIDLFKTLHSNENPPVRHW